MISDNNKKFLRKISFLENFTDDELLGFFQNLEGQITLKQGETLIKDGEVDKNLYIILSGQLSIYKKKGQKRILVATINKGEVLGEMSEYVEESRAVSVAVSTIEAKFLKVTIKKYPLSLRLKIRENHCHILAKRFIKKNDECTALTKEMANLAITFQEKANIAEQALRDENEDLKKQIRGLKVF